MPKLSTGNSLKEQKKVEKQQKKAQKQEEKTYKEISRGFRYLFQGLRDVEDSFGLSSSKTAFTNKQKQDINRSMKGAILLLNEAQKTQEEIKEALAFLEDTNGLDAALASQEQFIIHLQKIQAMIDTIFPEQAKVFGNKFTYPTPKV
ncbi:MAG: hypothetical protein LCH30_10165 [Proteobacteria bacterium]|nr:hypothetical protein [Pseudomonadota bacterium]